jgi:FtsZ-binding cell division protein ZapB
MRVLVLVVLVLLGVFGRTNAQVYTVTSTVVDRQSQQELGFATVWAVDTSGLITSITSTDNGGSFTLYELSRETTSHLSVSLLGYSPLDVQLDFDNDNVGVPREILLAEGAVQLSEIRVTAEHIPVVTKGPDTTVYNTAAYTDSTEFSIEELMQKLPGFSISEQGSITVNGESIDKVLIEGDDMFGGNYTVATRNIRSQFIKQVEVIDDYTPNIVLDNAHQQGPLVLNLIFNDDVKNTIAGTLTAGLGYGNDLKSYLHTNLFSFKKTSKTVLLANLNNVGFDSYGELDAGSIDLSSNDFGNSIPQIDAEIDLDTDQYQYGGRVFPSLILGGLNSLVNIRQVWNLSENSTLIASGLLFSEGNTWFTSNQNELFTAGQSTFYSNDNTIDWRKYLAQGTLKHTFILPNKGLSIRSFLGTQLSSDSHNNMLLLSDDSGADEIHFENSSHQNNNTINLELTKKISRTHTFQALIDVDISSRRDSSNSVNPQFQNISEQIENLNIVNQDINQTSANFNGSLQYLLALKNALLVFKSGVKYKSNDLLSDLVLFSDETINLTTVPFSSNNNRRISGYEPFAEGTYKKSLTHWKFRGGLKLSSFQYDISQGEAPPRTRVLPDINIQYHFDEDTRLSSSFKLKTELFDVNSFYNRDILVDYQTFSRGLTNTAFTETYNYAFSFRHRNILKSWYFNARWVNVRFMNTMGINTSSNGILINSQVIPTNQSDLSTISIASEKYFNSISSRVRVNYDYNIYNSNIFINQSPFDFSNEHHNVKIDYGTGFLGAFNFYLTNDFGWSKSFFSNDLTAFDNDFIQWTLHSKIDIDISSKIKIKLEYQRINDQLNGLSSTSFDAFNLNMTYTVKGKKRQTNFYLDINNMLNEQVLSTVFSGVQMLGRQDIRLIPRFVMLKVDFSI